jgi:NAD(P)-dependent dehydrogenase (short-subunit alcohol dehydrogenase family)/acyl dehydratase/putative sterol carrier protein
MALNMDAIGKKIGPLKKDYDWKNVILYAIGVGAGVDELDYTYEKNLKVIPSFSIAAIFDFLGQVGAASNVKLSGILHGEQELIFHNPIPTAGTLTTEGKITHYYDKGPKGALVVGESETVHSNGKRLFTNITTIFARLDGGFGGEEAPPRAVEFPEREPDFAVDAAPSVNQPLLYRLSGDIFQLHVDPEFAAMVGFEKPIMHGLCTHGFACRALMASLTPGKPELVRRLACRFSRPLYPGDPIRTLIWNTADGKAVWRTINTRTGETVIDCGVFEYGEIPKDEIRFDGRVAVVTGAGGGLGRVYALEFAKRGAKIVVNDLGGARDGSGKGSKSPAQKVVEEIKAAGGVAVANYDNVATPEGGERIVKAALDAFGTLDILVNNAGILRDKSIIKMEPETWQAVLDVHLGGAYNVTRPAFAVMKEKGYGRIIMTTSAAGLYGNFGQTNYGAAKMGLVGLMNTLKIEGAKYNIKVNTIAPIAASRLMADIIPPEVLEKMKPGFVAPLVLYLASEGCPVTGRSYNAGVGYYGRAAVMTSPGTVIGDGQKIPTLEEVGAAWERIQSLDGAKEYGQLADQMGDMLNAFAAKPAPAAAATPGTATSADSAAGAAAQGGPAAGIASVAEVFAKMPGAFRADKAAGVNVVFQYTISGDGGGEWFAEIKDGTCRVAAGKHESPACTLAIASGDFLALMNGKLPAMEAYTSGKLKIGGDIMKSQLIGKLFKM